MKNKLEKITVTLISICLCLIGILLEEPIITFSSFGVFVCSMAILMALEEY